MHSPQTYPITVHVALIELTKGSSVNNPINNFSTHIMRAPINDDDTLLKCYGITNGACTRWTRKNSPRTHKFIQSFFGTKFYFFFAPNRMCTYILCDTFWRICNYRTHERPVSPRADFIDGATSADTPKRVAPCRLNIHEDRRKVLRASFSPSNRKRIGRRWFQTDFETFNRLSRPAVNGKITENLTAQHETRHPFTFRRHRRLPGDYIPRQKHDVRTSLYTGGRHPARGQGPKTDNLISLFRTSRMTVSGYARPTQFPIVRVVITFKRRRRLAGRSVIGDPLRRIISINVRSV